MRVQRILDFGEHVNEFLPALVGERPKAARVGVLVPSVRFQELVARVNVVAYRLLVRGVAGVVADGEFLYLDCHLVFSVQQPLGEVVSVPAQLVQPLE